MDKYVRFAVICGIALSVFMLTLIPVGSVLAQGDCAQTHLVQPGENLFRIGLRYGLLWSDLASWNGIENPNLIVVGQVLCVTGPATLTPPSATYGTGGPTTIYPGNPFGVTSDPRAYFPVVVLGERFELRGYNFPANTQVTIALTTLGNLPYVPYYVASTDANGAFHVDVAIPEVLRTASTVAVDARTTNGYYAQNWFYNR